MPDWLRMGVEGAVADYLAMLALKLRGAPFNKAEHNGNLLQLLNGRTRGSVERKHQNISAILIESGFPYIDGYKPLGNYQDLLREVLEERFSSEVTLEQEVEPAVTSPLSLHLSSSIFLMSRCQPLFPIAKHTLAFTRGQILGCACRNETTLRWKRAIARWVWPENSWC